MDPNSLQSTLTGGPPFLKELLLILAGGACAALGGFLSTWYQSSRARKIRFEEILGERKVAIYQKALLLAMQLQEILLQATAEEALSFTEQHHAWLCDNVLFLPHPYEQNWQSIRFHLRSLIRRQSQADAHQHATELTQLQSFMRDLAKEMEATIRKELNLPPVTIRRPPKNVGETQ